MLRWLRNLFGTGSEAVASAAATTSGAISISGFGDVVPGEAGAGIPWPSPGVSAPEGCDNEAAAASPLTTVPAAALPPASAPAPGISWLIREDLNAEFTTWLFERSDYADLHASRAEENILAMLDKILASPQSGAQLVRRMPGVIPQLLQSLRTNDFSGADLARKISNDVVLVAEVIRLANSSLYATADPISSIEHAVLVLGQAGLRHLVTSVAFRPIVDLKSGYFNRLVAPRIWLHSEQCAIASRLLAQQAGLSGFDSFLAGLIQNVGLIVALRVMDEGADGSQSIGSSAFCNALIPKARRLSASIGREWNFPAEVIAAIDEQEIVQRSTVVSAVGRNLSMADYLSKLNLLVRSGQPQIEAMYLAELSPSEHACYLELVALTSSVSA